MRSSSPGDLFSQVFSTGGAPGAPPVRRAAHSGGLPAPRPPATLAHSGLSLVQISNLLLKQLYLQAGILGVDMARHARLPFHIVDDALAYLKDERCIEVTAGEAIGRASYRFQLTELGRNRAREAFELCRYVGPAPVPLDAYVKHCQLQSVHGVACDPDVLREAFRDLILRPGLLEELGPAVCSGRSIFLYGPPGNGKTLIAKGLGRFLNRWGGDIYVPYALQAEGGIITVFDPSLHTPTDVDDPVTSTTGSNLEWVRVMSEADVDLRWRRVRRPVVITGGELTLDMLDLRYNSTANFYQAPLHLKANGGVFLIDDFGRQIVGPRELLNRWILPLDERIDHLTLVTGKKVAVPFEQLIIFSTNLDPRELVDEAFLRRIRHKIHIGPPERELFTEIFRLHCEQRQIAFRPEAVNYLYSAFYDRGKSPRCSDSRDLLEIAGAICRFRRQELVLTEDLLAEATRQFFCQI